MTLTDWIQKKLGPKKMPHGRKINVTLRFHEDVTKINEQLQLNLENKPSWVLEIAGLDEVERDVVHVKYDRLRRPKEDWVTGVSALYDIHDGDVTEFHDVSPFFDTLRDLQYKASSHNPPPNTSKFQPKETREWHFSK